MSQFWQNSQAKLQPKVPMEKLVLPGRKWNMGFFSMGSMFTAHGLPYTLSLSLPPSFTLTPQKPACALAILQYLLHARHWTAPPSNSFASMPTEGSMNRLLSYN
jgi:hypothetical protein